MFFMHKPEMGCVKSWQVAKKEYAAPSFKNGLKTIAKQNTITIKMESTAGTGFFYVKKKNPRTLTEKLVMRKYDPKVRKHVEFKETKIK